MTFSGQWFFKYILYIYNFFFFLTGSLLFPRTIIKKLSKTHCSTRTVVLP